MDDLLIAKRVGRNRTICLSTLPSEALEEAGQASGGGFGYFIYEVDHSRGRGGLNVLAKVFSLEAALRIVQLAEAALSQPAAVASSPSTAAK